VTARVDRARERTPCLSSSINAAVRSTLLRMSTGLVSIVTRIGPVEPVIMVSYEFDQSPYVTGA
jgi:hypothetical protein